MAKAKKSAKDIEDEKFPLPIYDKKDDIYSKEEEVALNPDEEESNIDLDIPGAELDDKDEAIGEEDEENNYYSLGGDNHEDLEEDRD